MDPIYQQLAGLLERKERLAFAVLVETKGSTPQKCGAKAIFLPDGRILGTLGGGCLEAETRQKALRAIETGESFSFRAVLDDDFGWDDGLICGGSVQTFVQPDPRSDKVWQALLAEPAKLFILSARKDHAVNAAPALGFALLLRAPTFVMEGDCGHLSPGCEAAEVNQVVADFLTQ